jgi:hypothetical protein
MAKADWIKDNPETVAKIAAGLQLALDGLRDPGISIQGREAVKKDFPDLDPQIFDLVWTALPRVTPQSVVVTTPMIEAIIKFNNLFDKDKTDIAAASELVDSDDAARGVEMVRSGAVK